VVQCTSEREDTLEVATNKLANHLKKYVEEGELVNQRIQIIGPADASISRINDVYRKVIYIKTKQYDNLVLLKDRLEWYVKDNRDYGSVNVQFDFNPVNGF
jgi:primosomal protein N' (replication factor Y)